MPALLKTTQIQEPSSASVNIQLDSSGNVALVPTAGSVGIGTTSPGYKLEVKGASGAQGYLSIHDGTGDTTVSGNNAASLLFQTRDTSIRTIAEIDAVNTTTNGTGGAMVFQTRISDTLAERMRITANGAISFGSSGTATGTSGQVLTSAGSGASPTWSTISATGTLIRAPQIKTSGTSYTTPSNCTAIYVECVGGGGGAGGTGSSAQTPAGGGGGGGYTAKYFTVTGSTAYTYAIGSGGSGGSQPNNGSSGGNTTFTVGATTITANGGSGGGGSGGSGTPGFVGGGAGGSSSNGDLNGAGNNGIQGISVGSGNNSPGAGGSSIFGGSNQGYGGGGSANGTFSTGNSGTAGVIRIWEFT